MATKPITQLLLAFCTLVLFVSCGKKRIPSFDELESKYVEVKGSKIHYKEVGSGAPILFVHGNLTNSYLWRNIMPEMSKYGRCIALDLVGMGKSERPNIGYHILDQNDYFFEFIRALDLDSITLVGIEWGAALSMNYFSKADHRIKGMVLMEPVIGGTTFEELAASQVPLLETYGRLRQDPDLEAKVISENLLLDEILPQFTLQPLSPDASQAYRTPFESDTSRMPLLALFEALPINRNPQISASYLSTFRGPVYSVDKPKLLIKSTQSYYLTPDGIAFMKERMKSLSVVDVGEAGILIPEDQPEAVLNALESWFVDNIR